VLDAQYMRVGRWPKAVPQRRRRVFVVGYLGDWRASAEVLAIREGVQGHIEARRASREAAESDIAGGVRGGCWPAKIDGAPLFVPEVIGALMAKGPQGQGVTILNAQQYLAYWWDGSDCAPTLTRSNAGGSQRMPDQGNLGAVLQPVCVTGDRTHTLTTADGVTENGSGRGTPIVAIGTDCYNGAITGDVAATLGMPGSSVNASGPTVAVATHENPASGYGMAVRRLTPRECERLQGFPDDWTLIPWRGKAAEQCPDSPRYKALGNSMACNCMAWIGERIQRYNDKQQTEAQA
jgi:DNA (cytosine-5)-methyltransferase 1